MKTDILDADDTHAIRRAVEILRAGGLVAFPTDTVYGLGALAFRADAVDRLYDAKDRPEEKAIPILLADISDLHQVAAQVTPMAARLAARFWPGALTLVVAKYPGLPEAVSATLTVGVRVPAHPFARMLLQAAGPMAVTSANRSGQSNANSASEVMSQLDGRIDLILDGGVTPGGVPSTVVDCTGQTLVILRRGPLSEIELLAALGSEFSSTS